MEGRYCSLRDGLGSHRSVFCGWNSNSDIRNPSKLALKEKVIESKEETGKLSRYLRLGILGGLAGACFGALLGWFAGSIGSGAMAGIFIGGILGEFVGALRASGE